MKISKGLRLAALLPALAMLVASCGQTSPEPGWKIVIGIEPSVRSSAFWIAENKDYFQKEGLNVELKEFPSGRTALRTMLNMGTIDISTAAQTPVVFYSFDRNDFAIIGGMVHSDKDVKMLARQDRGISAPSDLKGKTVGITKESAGHFFLALFLAHYQMQMSEIKILDMEAPLLSQALIEGQVDAIATWEPHIYNARKALGNKALPLSSGDISRLDFYFIARKDFIKNNPEALKRFLRAIEKGQEFIRKNTKEAMDNVGQRLKMDREALNATWSDFQFRLFLDQSILTSLEDQARWVIDNRLTETTKVPNYLDFIHTAALKAVKPEAVTIIGE